MHEQDLNTNGYTYVCVSWCTIQCTVYIYICIYIYIHTTKMCIYYNDISFSLIQSTLRYSTYDNHIHIMNTLGM